MQECLSVLKPQVALEKELLILINNYVKNKQLTLHNEIDPLIIQSLRFPQDYLIHICKKFLTFVDNDISQTLKPIKDILRSQPTFFHILEKSKTDRYDHPFTYTKLSNGRVAPPPSHHSSKIPHQTRSVFAREICGTSSQSLLTTPSFYKEKFSRYYCTLGHLSSVYCVLFDRTGHYIFTGADDHLVKIWGAWDGRLLATLRGHTAEITDLTINWENTLVGASSTNKIIRVWSLKSNFAPVAVLTGHSAMISMLQFSPFGLTNKRYLVSCGNDGNVCIWTYGATSHEFDPNPLKFIERARPGNQMLYISFSPGGTFLAAGGSDHFTRIYYFGNERPEKIDELEVHTDRVDSIKFSNHSSRFVTGSRDGFACIWSLSNKKWSCVVLSMATKLVSEREEEKSSKLRVTMVSWNCDDSYVITAVTNFRIKVWDSYKGHLIHDLKAHKDDIFVLEFHPRDPTLMISASHDGDTILWNIVTGTIVKTIFNNIENRGHGAIFDCKFSPHGLLLAATDSHGQLIIMGLGTNEEYKKSPYEQFFHTDFRPLVRDINNYVVDEQTQLAPHLMPAPFLVDIDGNPYPPHVQRRVPRRHDCLVDQLVPSVLPNEDGEMEILDFPASSNSTPQPVPPLLSASEASNEGTVKDKDIHTSKESFARSLLGRIIYAVDPSILKTELLRKKMMAESEIKAYNEESTNRKFKSTRLHTAHINSTTSLSRHNNAHPHDPNNIACSTSSTNSSRGYFSDIINKYTSMNNKKSRTKTNDLERRKSLHENATIRQIPNRLPSGQSSHISTNSPIESSSSPGSVWEGETALMDRRSNRVLGDSGRIKPLPKRNCISIHQKIKRRRVASESYGQIGENDVTVLSQLDKGDGLNGPSCSEGACGANDWTDTGSTSGDSDDSDWLQHYGNRGRRTHPTKDDPEPKVMKRGRDKKHINIGSGGLSKRRDRRIYESQPTKLTRSQLKRANRGDALPLPSTSSHRLTKRGNQSSLKIWAAGAKRLATSYQRKCKNAQNGPHPSNRSSRAVHDGFDRNLEQRGRDLAGKTDRWWLRKSKGNRYFEFDGNDSSHCDDIPSSNSNVKARVASGRRIHHTTKRYIHIGLHRAGRSILNRGKRTFKPHRHHHDPSKPPLPAVTSHSYNTRRGGDHGGSVADSNSPRPPLSPSSVFFPPEWMTETLPKGSPFVPQIGDEVIYLRQGHERYVHTIRKLGLYPLETKGLPYVRQPSLRPVQFARVTGLRYEIRPPRLCCVKLSIIDRDTGQLTGGLFTLKYHDVAHVVDFLVLKQHYDRGGLSTWWDDDRLGQRIRAYIDDRWWRGTLVDQAPLQPDECYDTSPFLRYTVKWDNGDTDKMSPWDMEPIMEGDGTAIGSKGSSTAGMKRCRDENGMLNYENKPGEWSVKLGPEADCLRIKKGLESIMTLAIAEPFSAPVDLRAYPAYAQIVPYPIDLNTIKERVANYFYRRQTALIYDIRMILTNAQTFNEADSIIVKHAKHIVEICENLVSDESCQPLVTYKRLICDQLLQDGSRYPKDRNTILDKSESMSDAQSSSKLFNGHDNNIYGPTDNSLTNEKDWFERCSDLLTEMMSLEDSEPFRLRVNLEEYPDYLAVIKHPMDLSSVLQNLTNQFYASPQEVRKDVRLVFANSRAYNTNKRSRIYGMTLRLSALFEERVRKLIDEEETRSRTLRKLRLRNRESFATSLNHDRSRDTEPLIPFPSSFKSKTTTTTAPTYEPDDRTNECSLPYDEVLRHRGRFRGLRSFAAASASYHGDLNDNPPRASPPSPPPPIESTGRGGQAHRRSPKKARRGTDNFNREVRAVIRDRHSRAGTRSSASTSIETKPEAGKALSETKRSLRSLRGRLNYDEKLFDEINFEYERSDTNTAEHNLSHPSSSYLASKADGIKGSDNSSTTSETSIKNLVGGRIKASKTTTKNSIYTSSSYESTETDFKEDSISNKSLLHSNQDECDKSNEANPNQYNLRDKRRQDQTYQFSKVKSFESHEYSSSSNTTDETPWNYGSRRHNARNSNVGTKGSSAPCRRSSRRNVKSRQDSDFEYDC